MCKCGCVVCVYSDRTVHNANKVSSTRLQHVGMIPTTVLNLSKQRLHLSIVVCSLKTERV